MGHGRVVSMLNTAVGGKCYICISGGLLESEVTLVETSKHTDRKSWTGRGAPLKQKVFICVTRKSRGVAQIVETLY